MPLGHFYSSTCAGSHKSRGFVAIASFSFDKSTQTKGEMGEWKAQWQK
jgi:hypothetical protein